MAAALIALGGLAGWRLLTLSHQRPVQHRRYGMSRLQGAILLGVFFILLAFLPGVADLSGAQWLEAAAVFYRSGSLVFGGGHVVLPLLQASVVPSG